MTPAALTFNTKRDIFQNPLSIHLLHELEIAVRNLTLQLGGFGRWLIAVQVQVWCVSDSGEICAAGRSYE